MAPASANRMIYARCMLGSQPFCNNDLQTSPTTVQTVRWIAQGKSIYTPSLQYV